IIRRLQTTVAAQNSHSNPNDQFSPEQFQSANNTVFENRRTVRRDFGDRFQGQEFIVGDKIDRAFHSMDVEARRFGRVDPKTLESSLNMLKEDNSEISSPVALKLLNFCGLNLPMYSSQRRIDLLHKVWDMLQERNFKFDVSHYNTLITLYLENDHDFLPINFLATLEKNAVEPNRVTFQRLIRRFAQMGDLGGVG
uniref:Pentatricopeptide repeat-containing protein n=1 Tax=Romanomermis culicivorax TaxID=13658 RepID=A0A915K6F1_ROMCU